MNNSYGMTVDNLLSSFPEVLKLDENINALATSIAILLSSRIAEIKRTLIYPQIDELPERLLDILAYDFKVDWYNYNFPIELKRLLIKSCFLVHKRLGTRGAMLDALHSISEGIDLWEWFEYGGEPYHFRVIFNAPTDSLTVSQEEIFKAINIYKPLRSVLDNDSVIYRTRSRIKISGDGTHVCYSPRLCGTYPLNCL